MGIAGGDGEVGIADAGIEEVGFAFEAIFVGAGFAEVVVIAAAGAAQGSGEGREEEKGEVGLEVSAEGAVEIEDGGGAELAAAALVGLGGVGEAIAEDDVAAVERREDDFGDGLGAIGEHQGEFGEGRDRAEGLIGGGGDEQGADAVAEGGSAGLTGGDDEMTSREEIFVQQLKLRGFAGAVEAFEGDEVSARHGVEFTAATTDGIRPKRRAACWCADESEEGCDVDGGVSYRVWRDFGGVYGVQDGIQRRAQGQGAAIRGECATANADSGAEHGDRGQLGGNVLNKDSGVVWL